MGTRTQLLLFCSLVALLLTVGDASDDAGNGPPSPWEGYDCDNIKEVPEDLRCRFVQEECPSDSRVPYTELYYCSVAPRGILARGGFMLILVCVLPLLFSLLGSTAELYFSPTMSLVSQTIPKMRPRFAGVTFVAIGNGAPDLSANISAIRSGQVALSAGAFTGAAMFVQCVVASEVIRISKGVKCKGAVLRDVGTYAVSIAGVGLCFYSGMITHWFVAGAVLVYIMYASWVFAGDEWHAAGRPALQPDRVTWDDLRAMLLQRRYKPRLRPDRPEQAEYSETLLPWAAVGDEEDDLGPEQATPDGSLAGGAERGGAAARGGGVDVETGAHGGAGRGTGHGATPNGVGLHQRKSPGADHHQGGGHAQRYLDFRTYQQAVWADLEDEPLPLPHRLHARPRAVELQSSEGVAQPGVRSLTPEPSHTQYQPPVLDEQEGHGQHYPGRASTGSLRQSSSNTGLIDLGLSGFGDASPVVGANGEGQQRAQSKSRPVQSQLAPGTHGEGVGVRAGSAGLESLGSGQPFAALDDEANGGGGEQQQGAVGGSRDGSVSGQQQHHHQQQQQQQQQQQKGAGVRSKPQQLSALGDGSAPGSLPMGSVEQQEGEGGQGTQQQEEELLWYEEREAAQQRQQRQQQRSWGARVLEQAKFELTLGESMEWHELPRWQQVTREITFRCLLLAHAAQRATIPQVDPASYSQQWLVVSMLCSPLAVLVYFNAYTLSAVLSAMAVGFVLATGVHVLTKDEEELPTLDLGTSFAFGPAILSLAGFFMGVLWIDSLASEVVGIVSLTSRLLGLPPSLVGLTLLAVGSSLGDFFGNPSMARRGHASTALTACFAGPLFNMLISMAAGFSSFFAKEGITRTPVQLTPDIALGVVFLVLYNIVVASMGLLNKSHIPEKFYIFARAWYALYILLACVLGVRELWGSS